MLREDLIDNIRLPDDTPPDLTQASKVIVSALFEAAANDGLNLSSALGSIAPTAGLIMGVLSKLGPRGGDSESKRLKFAAHTMLALAEGFTNVVLENRSTAERDAMITQICSEAARLAQAEERGENHEDN